MDDVDMLHIITFITKAKKEKEKKIENKLLSVCYGMDWKEMEGDKRAEIVLGIVVDVVLFCSMEQLEKMRNSNMRSSP